MFHIGMHKTSEVNQDVIQRHISNREKALPVASYKVIDAGYVVGWGWPGGGGGARGEGARGGGGVTNRVVDSPSVAIIPPSAVVESMHRSHKPVLTRR